MNLLTCFAGAILGQAPMPSAPQAPAPVVPLAAPAQAAPGSPSPAAPPAPSGANSSAGSAGANQSQNSTGATPNANVQSDNPSSTATPEDPGLAMKLLAGTPAGDFLERRRLKISGYTDVSYTPSNKGGRIFPFGQNDFGREFLLQQNTLRLEKLIDPDAKEITYGFRSDTILPGTDARTTVVRGLFDGQVRDAITNPKRVAFDPVQLYGILYDPNVGKGLELRAGRFFALFGAESIDPTLNLFGSRSYTFIFNPFTHTGGVATLKLSDEWTAQSGVVTGSDVFIDKAAHPTYIGSLKWADKDGKASLVGNVILGKGNYDIGEQFHNPQIVDFVGTYKITDKLAYTGEFLYGWTDKVPGIGFANWLGYVNYLSYSVGEKLSVNGRLEFFDDRQGQRTGTEGLYTAITGGVTYKPKPYLWIRPEIRYDTHQVGRPYQNDANLTTATLDVIFRW